MPTKKNSAVELAEELEMREGIGLMREGAFPCLEFGRGIGIRGPSSHYQPLHLLSDMTNRWNCGGQ